MSAEQFKYVRFVSDEEAAAPDFCEQPGETTIYMGDVAYRKKHLFASRCNKFDKYSIRQYWYNHSLPKTNFEVVGDCIKCKACGNMSEPVPSTMLYHKVDCEHRIDPVKEPWLFHPDHMLFESIQIKPYGSKRNVNDVIDEFKVQLAKQGEIHIEPRRGNVRLTPKLPDEFQTDLSKLD